MRAIFRKVGDLLDRTQKLRLLALTPLALGASVCELAIVAAAASYFHVISDAASLEGDSYTAQLYQWSEVSRGTALIVGGLAVLSVVVFGNAFAAFANRMIFTVSWAQIVEVGTRTLSAYLYRPYEFFLVRSTPELAQRLLVEVQRVVKQIVVNLTLIGSRMFGAVLIVGWLIYTEPFLAPSLMVFLTLTYGAFFLLLRRTLLHNGRRVSETNAARHRVATESLMGAKTIKVHGLEERVIEDYREVSEQYADAMALQETLMMTSKYLLEAVALGGLVVVVVLFLLSGRPVESVLPVLATFAIAAFRLLPTFQMVFNSASRIQSQLWILDRVYDDIMEGPGAFAREEAPLPFEDAVRLEGVTYTYPTADGPVLADFDLAVRRGTWVAFVGSTGSGKSTLVDLLLGVLTPQSGTVYVDSQPLDTRATTARWQANIGYVPQSLFLTDGSIEANIAFGLDADSERVAHVANLAALAEFVESDLPQRYATSVGEGGIRLSGGQRQRIGLARALYRRPALLVLDEATSALDNTTEARVMRDLREEFHESTVIMVAHRLSTTRYCDEIILLDHGRIVGRGPYDELYATNEAFRKLVEAPAGPEAVEAHT